MAETTKKKPAKRTTTKNHGIHGRRESRDEGARPRAEGGSGSKAAAGEAEVQEAIAKMQPADRAMAKQVHAIVKANAPDLSPKTWYGMPAYANRTARSSASSGTPPSSRSGTRRSASTTRRTSTTAPCGRSRTR